MQVKNNMNSASENFTPRERVNDDLLARLLRENEPQTAVPVQARPQAGPCPRRTDNLCDPTRYSRPERASDGNSRCPARGRSLAMVYSPVQEFEELYDAEEGLCRGTIFRQLDLPLMVGKCQEGRWNR